MQAITCPLDGLLLVELTAHKSERGFFAECFNARKFEEFGVPAHFAQAYMMQTAPGVLRGLYYQREPAQGLLVGAIRGRSWVVAVDIRKNSPTLGHYYGVELTEGGGLLYWIPAGFAHGFCVLGDEPAEIICQVTAPFRHEDVSGIRYDDERIGIRWPLSGISVSQRDKGFGSFDQYLANPAFTHTSSSHPQTGQ